MSLEFILKYANDITSSFGVYSYSVTKYLALFEDQSLASTSSGRDSIYELAFARIFESPWFGSPINSSFYDTGASYYHNIILDVAVTFGLPGISFFMAFIIWHSYKAFKTKNKKHQAIFLILIIIPMGRLFVSSSFWQRPEFWIFISFCIHQNNFFFKNKSAQSEIHYPMHAIRK